MIYEKYVTSHLKFDCFESFLTNPYRTLAKVWVSPNKPTPIKHEILVVGGPIMYSKGSINFTSQPISYWADKKCVPSWS